MTRAVEVERRPTFWQRIGLMSATGFGAGYSPFAPGTVGSLEGVALFLLIEIVGRAIRLGLASQIAIATFVALCTIIFGIWAADQFCRRSGVKDPQQIIVDEIAGQLIALLPLAGRPSVAGAAAAFLLFRAFDILKPYPAGRLEHLPGGRGVMLDDVMAGVYAGLIVLAGVLYRII